MEAATAASKTCAPGPSEKQDSGVSSRSVFPQLLNGPGSEAFLCAPSCSAAVEYD